MDAWITAVLEWVNCLDILETNVNNIKELRDGRFFSKLIKILSNKEFEDDCDDEELVSRFIQDSYPEFLGDDGKGNDKIEETYVASLLLLHASQEPKLHRPMCIKLSNETQLKIKSFLEKVLELGSSVTRDNVADAITETGEYNYVRTPPVTPKMRPLKDFFNSPTTTVRKNYSRLMDERTRELRSLKAELETERFEKADLLEDLEIQRQKNNSLQIKLQEKIAEMKAIREETMRFETPQSSKKKRDVKTPRNRTGVKVQAMTEEISLLKSEILNLQEEKDSLARKLASAERQCLTFKEKCKLNERNLETLLIQGDIKDREIEELKIHNEELRTHFQEMRRQTMAEQSFEMEMSAMSATNSFLNGSEVLSTVVDIQLQEAKEESRVFKSKIEELKSQLDSIQTEYQALSERNRTLEAEVSLLESTKKELSEYIERNHTLEQEKTHFQKETAKFENMFLDTEELFKQSEQRNEVFRLNVNELENKLRTAEDLLSEEHSKVKHLEAVVSQKVESLKNEHLRYETLHQEHTELKQSKLDLLREREDLKNLIASKDDSLRQAQQCRESLELALQKLENELEKTQDLLRAECNSVKELESTTSQMKLEHERNIQGQSLKYCALEERHVTLEQEKVRLLQEIEHSNLRIVSGENQLKDSIGKNENLASELKDLNIKLQTAHNSLAEERKRVEDLEATLIREKSEKEEFTERQLSKYQILEEKHATLEQERVRLSQEIEDLSLRIASKENLLKESFKKNGKLVSDLEDVNNNLQTTENSLAEERKRIENLESMVSQVKTEKQEFMESQLSKYQTLEEKYHDLEQERVNLSRETEDLNLTIAAKESLLKESIEKNEKLAADLQDVSSNLETTENALAEERNKVENLETSISHMKFEHERTVEVQLSKFKILEERYVNLEHEWDILLQNTEDLNLKIASSQNLLKEAVEQTENLTSDLQDQNKKLQTMEKALTDERSRVEILESTISQMKLEHEKTLKAQFSKYKSLEEKYASLEQERNSLSHESEDLSLKIVSSQNLLKESIEKSVNLASELQGLTDKLQTSEKALDEEKNSVKNLEATVTLLETDKQEFMESQLLKYQTLEEKYENLERERLSLSQKTEDLNLKIASNDNLLKESVKDKQILASDLQDLNSKFEIAENSLAKTRNRVETLESKINQMKLEHEKTLEVQLSKYQTLEEKYVSLEQQRADLSRKTEDLNLKIESSENLLKESIEKNENLNSKLKTTESALTKEKKRVEQLESTVARVNQEKKDTLRNQLVSYEALEQEKMNLITEVHRLKTLISSKEELVAQLQQRNDKFESDTCGLNRNLQTLQDSLDAEKTRVGDLESKLNETNLRCEESLQEQVTRYKDLEEKYVNLEQEKVSLFKETENLNHKLKASEDSLTKCQQESEKLTLELQGLNDELKSLKDSLAEEKSKIEDLESTIIREKQEREEVFERQSTSYQILEEKRLNLEQEKLDLLKDSNALKNLILSKEELLQQSQQHSANLEGDLCAAKDEMKAVQDELNTMTTRIESLESEIAQSKLETERINQSNEDLRAAISSLESAKHDLYKLKETLEQEKSRLLGEMEELKAEVSSKEDLLKKIEQRNEILDSKVNDLGEAVKSAQNLLIEKDARMKDLESTLVETESERKESLSMIDELKLENVAYKNLIQSCCSILTELVRDSSRLTGREVTAIDDLTILDLSKELKTLINLLEVIHSSKDTELKNFQETVLTLNSTVSKLKTVVINFEEMKVKGDQVISEYLKEITDLKVIAKEKESLLEDMSKLKEQLSDERSKVDLLNKGKAALGRGLMDVKNSLTLLKKEKLILVENVQIQNRDLLNKMASISEIIGKMQDRMNLDDGVVIQLREEKSALALKYDEEKIAKMELESKCETLENDNKSHTKEKKELKEKLNVIRVRNAKLEKNMDELRKEIKKLETEKLSDDQQTRVEELRNSILKLQNEVQELEAEKMELSKRPTEARLKEIHVEYDQKLEKLKQKMKTAYNEQILKVNQDQERLMQEKLNAQRAKMEELCRKHAEEMTKYKDHVTKLSSDYWDVGEKLLVEKQQKEHLAQQIQALRKQSQMYERNAAINSSMSQSLSSSRNKTSSLDRREFGTGVRDELSSSSQRMVETIKEEVATCARRESIQSVQTMQGMGNAFKAEDEEGEVFNTNYLADMKAGRCSLAPDIDRLSVLQMRNAQCKPHLKSSYPAETQFQPGTFTEEEIKSGSAIEDVFNDSLSQSLLPGEKTKKRDRTQTLYKRPGPPTPSKNGGRLSLQGNELKSPNSRILRERNVERRSTATPRRLKDIFGGGSKRQDENVSGTPKGRRLSSIFRKPK